MGTAEVELDRLLALYAARGHESYGESVSQIEHALQCGLLAEEEGAAPELVTAAVLHDAGHLLHRDSRGSHDRQVDDRHEAIAARFLGRLFGPEVVEPVRLHVAAKRWFCLREPGYRETLSAASQISLRLQGGPMTEAEACRFEAEPHARAALRLRRWDEAAKRPGWNTPSLAHYRAVALRCLAAGVQGGSRQISGGPAGPP